MDRHVSMLMSAEFSTLSPERSFLIGADPKCARHTGDEITLAMQRGHPEAVDDIARSRFDDYRRVYGNVDLISRGESLVRLRILVQHFPPPLVTDHRDRKVLFGFDRKNFAPGTHTSKQENEKDEYS